MPLFRKKPIVVEAEQFRGLSAPMPEGVLHRSMMDPKAAASITAEFVCWNERNQLWMPLEVGDWIVTGIRGCRYPVHADVFADTYAPVEDLGKKRGWIAVDLDGTLAHYVGWQGGTVVGAPIPSMVKRVKRWLAQGRDVRIFTARCNPNSPEWLQGGREAVQEWILKHIGKPLPITCEKDGRMIELWDDRAVAVETNTGAIVAPRRGRFS